MATDPADLNFLPRPLKKALLDFQKQGVRFGISKQGRCLIGDEMGLGKTLQAISVAYYYRDAWPLLIIVPSSVKFSWIDEIEKWLPEVEPHDLNLIRSGVDVSNLSQRRIHIIGYGLLSCTHTSDLLLKAVEAQRFQVIIMDESHYLKNQRTKRTQRLYQISKKAKHVILLSGTPSLARPEELYIQLDIVCSGLFGSFTKFANRYCDRYKEFIGVGNCHMKWNTRGASNLNELHQLLRKHVMIRRLKKEVLTQLPPKRRQKIMFDVSQESKYMKELKSIKNDFKKCSAIMKGESRDDYSVTSPLVEMNRLSTLMYHYTGLVKMAPIQEYVTNLIDSMNGKIIVFYRHRLVMKGIIQRLVYKKVKYICICGDVPSSIRGDLVRQFQTDPQTRAAVLSIEAASFGLTLTAAHHVVFAELHHTPGIIIQAEDRAHRIGQTLPVNVHYLIARDTLDETMWAMIRRKVYVTSHTLDGKCKELQMENGDQGQSQRLSACAAWVQDQDENDNDNDLEEYVMAQLSSMTVKKDHSQRDLRAFFSPVPSSLIEGTLCNRTAQHLNPDIVETKPVIQIDTEPVCVLDSDDDLSGCTNLEDGTLTEKAPCSGGYVEGIPQTPENSFSEELQTTGDLHTNKGTPCSGHCEKGILQLPDNNSSEELQTTGDRDASKNAPSKIESLKNENQCQIKPKMLKFKKVKDGKLYLSSSKPKSEQMKREIGSRNHLDFVGNDPETDSQVLQTYVDNADKMEREEEGDVDEKIVGDATAHAYCKEERSFFASFRDAGTDCIPGLCSTATVPLGQINRRQAKQQENCGRKRKWLQKNSLVKDLFYSRTNEEGSDSNYKNVKDNKQSCGIEPSRSQTDFIPIDSCLEQKNMSISGMTIDPKKTVDEADAQTVFYPNPNVCDGCLDGQSLLVTGKNERGQSSSNRLSAGKKQTRWKGKDGKVIDSSIPCRDGCAMLPQPGECDVPLTETDSHNGDSSDEFENSKSRIIRRPPPPSPPLMEPRKGRRKKTRRKSQRTARLPKKRAIREEPSWSCNACTFINDGQLMECSVCFSPRSTEPAGPSCITTSSGSHEGVLCDKASESTSMWPDINSADTLCSTIEDRTPRSLENVNAASVVAVGQTAAYSNGIETSHRFTDETLDCNTSSLVVYEATVSTESVNNVSNVETASVGLSSTPVSQVETIDSRGPPPWSCSMCTFLNDSQMIECSLCLTPRRRSQRRSAREWSTPSIKRQSRKTNKKAPNQGSKNGGDTAAEETPTDCEETVVGEDRNGFLVSSPQMMKTDETDQKSRHGPVTARSFGVQGDQDSLSYVIDPCTQDVSVSQGEITSVASPVQSGSEVTFAEALSPVSSDDRNSLKCQPKKRLKLDVTCTNGASEDPSDTSGVFDDDFDKEPSCHEMPLGTSPEVAESIEFMDASCSESLPTVFLTDTNTSLHRKEETVEQLKAAAVEFFSSSDWEDDDLWWEEDDSSSGQSSLPCSRETESPSSATHGPSLTPGFERCSDLFSLTDLQNKLLSPQQSETIHKGNYEININHPSSIDNVFNDRICHTETAPCDSTADVDEVEEDELVQPPEPVKLKFCLSFYTDRVYLYSEDGAPLSVNFSMSDLKNRNTDDLPLILHHEYNLKQAKKFLQSWSRMGEGKRRVLRKSALIVDDPLLGYENARQGKKRETSYVRHPSQKSRINKVIATAEQVGGNVCIVSKPGNPEDKRRKSRSTGNNTNKDTEDSNPSPSVISTPESMSNKAKTCFQAFTADGISLCLFCGGPVNFGDGVHCSAWDKRFCSYDCKQEYQVLVSGTAVRRNLFELERGICQICHLNAHEIYNSVKALPVRERPAFLAGSVYSSLPPQTLKRMVMDPKEGMFWEADHIKPVAEGGGECGLDNYRTLCVLCHRKATEELNKRMRQKKAMQEAASCLNITTFFRPLS